MSITSIENAHHDQGRFLQPEVDFHGLSASKFAAGEGIVESCINQVERH